MDIQAWLQQTADREPPDRHIEHHPAEALLLQANVDHHTTRPARRPRPKRRRASSETSHPDEHRRTRRKDGPGVPERPVSLDRKHRQPVSIPSNSRSTSRHRSSSASKVAPVEIYEKRARHKTKTDKYDHKPERRKEKTGKKKRDETPRSKRRKSRRGADGSATAGLVQSFQLKNGPKHNRLTLKPDVSAGIFKHGRSSGPVAPAGKGLPDLVFNEMRFLQNPKEHQNELPPVEPPKEHTKKSRNQLREEEVSSFFANKPPTEKRPERPQSRDIRQNTAGKDARRSAIDRARPGKPPIDLPDNLFLGFGSRGPSHDNSAPPKGSNSEYTWSESPPLNLAVTAERPRMQLHHTGKPSSSRARQTGHNSNTPARRPGHTAPSSHPSRVSADGPSQRSTRTFLAEMQPQQVTNRSRHNNVVVSSESLPKIGSRRRTTVVADGNVDGEKGSNFHTSDILNLAVPMKAAYAAPTPQALQGEHEGLQPVSSGPDSDALRKAFEAVVKPHREAMPKNHEQTKRQKRHDSRRDDQISRGDTSRTNGLNNRSSAIAEVVQPRWMLPQRGFSRASERSQSLQDSMIVFNPARMTDSRRSLSHHLFQHNSHAPGYNNEDDEMLDDPSAAAPAYNVPDSYAFKHSRQTEDLVRRLTFNESDRAEAYAPPQSDYPDRFEQFEEEQRWTDLPADLEFEEGGQEVVETISTFDRPTSRGIEETIDDGLVGFWRPNRLY